MEGAEMTEDQKTNIELGEALSAFDESPEIPDLGEDQIDVDPGQDPFEDEPPEEEEAEEPKGPDHLEAGDRREDHLEAKDGPNWEDATAVMRWFGSEIVRLIKAAKREKALTRLRALSSAVDSWAKLRKLSLDSSEIEQIRAELESLKRELELEKRGGPQGVVRK
jgi:hypothetical protein